MSLYYLDSSAAVKLLVEESHTAALAQFYDSHATSSWVSSTLLRVEVVRAVRRAAPESLAAAADLLQAFGYLPIDDAIVDAAAWQPQPALRSLDALHLATARVLEADLAGLVTYDDRLASAADAAGLPVLSPTTPTSPRSPT